MKKTIHNREYKKIIGKLIIARKENSLTQKDVAKKIKRPQSYISKIETGEQRLDIVELKVFAKLYKKRISYFLGN